MLDISDIKASIQSGVLIKDKFFKNADFLKDSRGRLITFTGGYTIVVPAIVKGEKWAFRCWHTPVSDAKKRYSLISKTVNNSKLPYFCSFEYQERGLIVNGETYPTTKMRWIEGLNLKKYICKNFQNSKLIKKLSKKFLDMVIELHSHKIAHGDLQHGNIMITDSDDIFLIDYDSMYVPDMKDRYSDVISGLVDYQHPSRKSNAIASEHMDYFSEVIIYTSLLGIAYNPDFVRAYNVENSESLLFNSKDFDDFKNSKIYNDLRKLNNEDINRCIDILVDYLSISDINRLNPIEDYLMTIDVEYPHMVAQKETFTLKWSTKGVSRLELSEVGEVPLLGTKNIVLSSSKTFVFNLVSKSGYESQKSIIIKVVPRAVINYFKADKEYTLATVPVTISWACLNTKKVTIIGLGEQNPSGSLVLTPEEDVTYTLCVEDDFGIQKKMITIKKLPLPIIRQILVPLPRINTNLGISYQAPKFHISIPTPTFDTILNRVYLPKVLNFRESVYYVHSLGWDKNNNKRNIFKSLFSIFFKKKK